MAVTLPTCEACNTKLNWKKALKSQRFGYEYTTCPYCREKQYIATSLKVRILTPIISVSPLILNLFLDLSFPAILSTFAIVMLFAVVASPFAYTLKSNDPILQSTK